MRLILLLTLLAAAAASAVGKPNFVIIMADDLGYGDLSTYDGWIETPNLDRLAAEGMKFTDFHSNGAVCSPTRAALLTGRYQERAGIPGVVYADPKRPQHEDGLQSNELTFAEALSDAGYVTGMFGKWHLGYFPKYNPVRNGFDEFRGYVSGNVDFFSHVDQAAAFDWWIQDELKDEPDYTTHLINRHAVDFIARQKDKPFCLYIPHEAPHSPYQGPGDKPYRVAGDLSTMRNSDVKGDDIKRAYREMVQEVDKGVGQVLEALEKHGVADNTLVVFMSDNGANNNGSNKPLRGSKGNVFEGGHRVPGIARWPGKIEAGSTNASLAMSMDWMPTMLSLANAMPADHKFDGINLSPALFDGKRLPDRKAIWRGVAMRDGKWKLVVEKKRRLLFDLEADLGEQNDLANQHPERVMLMTKAIEEWKTDIAATRTAQPSDGAE